MSIILLILGIWLFWDSCQKEFQSSKIYQGKDNKLTEEVFSFLLRGGTVFLVVLFLFTTTMSTVRTLNVLDPSNLPSDDPQTARWLRNYAVFDLPNRELYERIRASSDVSYLLVPANAPLRPVRWMTYHARGNPIYHLNGRDNHRLSVNDLTELPLDVIILRGNWSVDIVSNPLLHEDFAAIMIFHAENAPLIFYVALIRNYNPIPAPPVSSLQLNVFARESVSAILRLYPAEGISPEAMLSHNGNSYELDPSGAFIIPLYLQAGGQEIMLSTQNDEVVFRRFYLDIDA